MPKRTVADGLRSIAANIRRIRVRKGLTQEELAERADVEPRYVQTLESGRANPSATILIKVAAALDVSPGTLFRPARLPKSKVGRPRKKSSRRKS